jgi:septum site-determining protein MinD
VAGAAAPTAPTPVRVVAVSGARDGVGKTTFAVNLALSLLKETRARVLLLDLDGESVGDCQALLGLPATGSTAAKTILDFAPYLGQLQPVQLRQYISAHSAGMGIVPLAPAPDRSHEVTPDAVAALLALLAPLCDYIVVDCGAGLSDRTLRIFEQSAGVFLLTTPEPSVVRHTRRLVERLQNMQFPKELLKVVLSHQVAKSPVTLEQVNRLLGRKVMVALPHDGETVLKAALEANPFTIGQPRARLTRVFGEFTRQVVEKGALDRMLKVARPQGVQGIGAGRGGEISAEHISELKAYAKKRGKGAGKVDDIDPRTAVKMLIHKRIVETLDLKDMDHANDADADEALRHKVTEAAIRILDDVGNAITDRGDRQRIVVEVVNEALGLGPLEDFLEDERITEIMVNGRNDVFVEMSGKLVKTGATFTDDAQLLGVIERIVAPIGRRIDEKSPMVDARLKDGSRVNAIIPPLALDGPSLTIRKFSATPFTVKDLVKFGSFTTEIADFLRACVEAHLNILISGGTGSGKTTLLNVMSSFIPEAERIVTVEDSAELNLGQPHIVRLETRPANIEGEGEVAIRDLVRNSLRMRPDRIVVGECRGSEAIDMLQAMNTGHDGSMTTIHSNSPRDCIARLETLVMFAGLDLPSRAIREQISAAINIIVQASRLSDGSRKITSIAEVTGMEGQVITLQDIFVFKQEGVGDDGKVQGRFLSTGFVPRFVQDLQARGIALPRGIFTQPDASAGRPDGRRGRTPRGRR